MYVRFTDRARKVVQLAKQSPPPTSPQPPGVATASRTTAPIPGFGREIAERLTSSQRDFLAGAATLPGGRWGPSLLSAAKNLAGTGISAQILRFAQND